MIDEKINIEKSFCTGCCACFNACPVRAISMDEDYEGFKYPLVDKKKCIKCGLCLKICPTLNEVVNSNNNNVQAYACINKNTNIRLKSSSGGVFSAFAEYILENDGIIFGAAFDERWNVKHKYIADKKYLDELRTSKYVQSYVGEAFKEVKSFLSNGKPVLFTGTPCQIGGLKAYLGKEYKNLYCIDIICHGVPSPLVWNKFLNENYDIENIKNINFRNKTTGWSGYSFKVNFTDKAITESRNDNLYMLGFLNDLYLRPSCYNCKFKSINRFSDLTIADFWGVDKILPEMNDEKGTSLVFVQNDKGRFLLKKIYDNIRFMEVSVNVAINYNGAMIKSASMHRLRKKFFDELKYNNKNINTIIGKYYIYRSLRKKISYKIRSWIKSYLNRNIQ